MGEFLGMLIVGAFFLFAVFLAMVFFCVIAHSVINLFHPLEEKYSEKTMSEALTEEEYKKYREEMDELKRKQEETPHTHLVWMASVGNSN